MIHFAFNEDSYLNNPFVRSVNWIILFLLFICFIGNEATPPIKSYWQLFFIIIISSLCIYFCSFLTMRDTHFFEEQKEEREKKFNYLLTYIFIASILSISLALALVIFYGVFVDENYNASILIFLIPVLVFIFNLVNIPSLFFPLFESYLEIS